MVTFSSTLPSTSRHLKVDVVSVGRSRLALKLKKLWSLSGCSGRRPMRTGREIRTRLPNQTTNTHIHDACSCVSKLLHHFCYCTLIVSLSRTLWSWRVNITTGESKPTGHRHRHSCWRDVLNPAKPLRRMNKLPFTIGGRWGTIASKGTFIHLSRANVVVEETGWKTACGPFVPEFLCDWCLHPWRQTVHLHNNIGAVAKSSQLKKKRLGYLADGRRAN